MFAVFATGASPDDPLSALAVGDRPDPIRPPGWVSVNVRATALNHHDLWTLRGIGIQPTSFPMILGCDASGIDDNGNEVIVYPVISSDTWHDDETLDPERTLLSEWHQGTLAERVVVPATNVIAKPVGMTWAEAACLPTAWLTAYRMLFGGAGLRPGDSILVQGVTGGVSSALIRLGAAAGLRVYATSRDPRHAQYAIKLGAREVFAAGAVLPQRVDAVMETVGGATWEHSIGAVRDGGAICISGATTGDPVKTRLNHIFFRQLRIYGSTMGSKRELKQLIEFMESKNIRPLIHSELPMSEARTGLKSLLEGGICGKIVLRNEC